MVTTVVVAMAGTPEAATADFVCDGSDDQIEINAALQMLQAIGGGTLSISSGLYRTTGNINVGGDDIRIIGPADRSAIIQTQLGTPQGSVIAVFGNNCNIENISIDSSLVKTNGISYISCEFGLVKNCFVKTYADHTYGIWIYDSEGIDVIQNEVDGGSVQHKDQEGIEISSSKNVTVSNNVVRNIGGNGIFVYNWGVSQNIDISDNNVSSSNRSIMIFHEGSGFISDVSVNSNTLTGAREASVYFHISSSAHSDGYLSNIHISNNLMESANAIAGALPYVSAVFLENRSGIAYNISNISVFNNDISNINNSVQVGAINAYSFNNFSIYGNNIIGTSDNIYSRAINIIGSHDFLIHSNIIHKTGSESLAIHDSRDFTIHGNDIYDFNLHDSSYSAISLQNSTSSDVFGNQIRASESTKDVVALNISQNSSFINAYSNDVFGNELSNTFYAEASSLTLSGLGGDDTYFVNDSSSVVIETSGNGFDHIFSLGSYVLGSASHVEKLSASIATATTALNLNGNMLAQELTGNAGANILDGGGGADILRGLEGNDVYYVNEASVKVVETDVPGRDVVYASIDYALDANNYIEVLSARGHANTSGLSLTGNNFSQEVWGNAGDNILDGGGGKDTLVGLGGNDIYYVDDTGVRIVEGDVAGRDVVYASVDYTLSSGAYVEVLSARTHAGTTAISLKGNEFAQEVWGNAGANILDGASGNDTLVGLEGADELFGGAGTDVARYRGLRVNYSIATHNGSLQIVDLAPSIDGDDETDTLVGVEFARFNNGEVVGISSPIILDLDGLGVMTVSAFESAARFDLDGDGIDDDTSWFGPSEGLLVLDRDGNGTVSNAGEFSFTGDVAGARSDLEGLAAFDSNGDRLLSELDDRFSDFLIWADRNGNGTVDRDEMLTLADAGVAAINLTGEAAETTAAFGDVAVINKGSYTRTDGSSMEFLDVALTYFKGDQEPSRSASVHQKPDSGFNADSAVMMLSVRTAQLPNIRLEDFFTNGASESSVPATGGHAVADCHTHQESTACLFSPMLTQICHAMASFAPEGADLSSVYSLEVSKPIDISTQRTHYDAAASGLE